MSYKHYNRSLQKMIHTKEDYWKEMKRQGMVPLKEAEAMAKDYEKRRNQPHKVSDKTIGLVRSIGDMRKDKNGKIKLSDRQIDAMKATGVNFNPSFRPTDTKGGF